DGQLPAAGGDDVALSAELGAQLGELARGAGVGAANASQGQRCHGGSIRSVVFRKRSATRRHVRPGLERVPGPGFGHGCTIRVTKSDCKNLRKPAVPPGPPDLAKADPNLLSENHPRGSQGPRRRAGPPSSSWSAGSGRPAPSRRPSTRLSRDTAIANCVRPSPARLAPASPSPPRTSSPPW